MALAPGGHAGRRQAATQPRTIGRLWRDAIAQRRDAPPYLVERARRLADGLVDGGRGGRRRARERAAGARRQQGRRVRDPPRGRRLEWALFDFALGLIGAIGAPVYPYSSTSESSVHRSSTRSPSASLCEDEEQRAKLEGVSLAHRLTFADLDDAARARPRASRASSPDALAAAAGRGRRGRPLHLHLHVGHDRPAQGLHDPPPQLLRDVPQLRGDRQLHEGRHAAALPAARAQLRPAACICSARTSATRSRSARPALGGRDAAGGAPDRASRACRASTRRCTRPSRRSSPRRRAPRARLIDWALDVGRQVERAAPAGAPRAARPGRQAPDRRPARLLEGQGAPRRPAARRDLRRRAAGARGRGVLRRARHPASSRATG